MRLTHLVAAGILSMSFSCEQAPAPPMAFEGVPPQSVKLRDIWSFAALEILMRHRYATGSKHYDPLIDSITDVVCDSSCELPATRASDPRVPPGDAVIALGQSGDPRAQRFAVDVACALCSEISKPCRCDGRRCEPEDLYVPAVGGDLSMECGYVAIDGVRFPWGQAVRGIPKYNPLWRPPKPSTTDQGSGK